MNGSLQIRNGRYHMVLAYVDHEGKSKRKWKATGLSASVKGNEKLALQMLMKWSEEMQGCDIENANQLMSDYMKNWLPTVEANLKATTIRGYRGILKCHILPYFSVKKIKVTELRVLHLEQFYAYLMKEKSLSSTSVCHCHRLISRALKDAVRYELIRVNPATLVQLPKQQKYEAKFLNYSQLEELSLLFKGHILQPIVQFVATYGLRRGEVLGLCWDQVNFDHDCFTICRTFSQVDGGNVLNDSTKNESSRRTMPLTSSMRKLLLQLKERRDKYAPLFPKTYAENNFVFVWEDGTPIKPNYVTKEFHKMLEMSDLPTIRLHDLRHSAASNLLANGWSVVETQKWLGHSLPSTTLNFYAHVDSSFKKRIGDYIENTLVFEDTDEIG